MTARATGTAASSGSGGAIAALATTAIVVGVALRLVAVWLIPFGPAVQHRLQGLNDEPAHFAYVEHLATRRQLPVQVDHIQKPGAIERAAFEYYQPPLYYAAGAALYAVLGRDTGLRACRLLSALCGLLTLVAIARILARCGLPATAARLGVAFASLFLTHAYFCALVSNDALGWLLGAVVLLKLVDLVAAAPSDLSARAAWRRGAALTALLGAGLLTKSSGALYLPVAAVAYALVWRRARDRRPLIEGAAVLVAACAIALPWWLRSVALYGSPFGLEAGFGPPIGAPLTTERLYQILAGTIRYFWFPMQHLTPSAWLRGLWLVGAVIVAVHAGAWSFATLRRGLSSAERLMVLCLLLALASHLWLNIVWSEPEGRFLLPAFAAIVYGFTAMARAAVEHNRWEGAAAIELLAVAAFPYLLLAAAT